MLPESRLYSFIDQKEGFTVHFFEGQKLIQDLAVIHHVIGGGFQYFRDAILSFQPMISFLKPGEGLGIYLDSDSPYFRLKIEMSDQGQMRTLLLPEEFNEFPKMIKGKSRIVKLSPSEQAPYTSIINLDNIDFHQVVNKILSESYQINSEVFVSEDSDQSVMLMKLPEINVNKVQTNYVLSCEQYWKKIEEETKDLLRLGSTEQSDIQTHFEKQGLIFLGSKEIKFKCTCSRQRMLDGVRSLVWSSGIDTVFDPSEDSIETKCDYCHTSYLLNRDEFTKPI
ncbi:MAG: Hsp33 family molecular chaperone HslO [Bdellovibrionales bacterium]|nr:Hsp33 family molecular chaperone HslO [Bdellovibrionales bacterium]